MRTFFEVLGAVGVAVAAFALGTNFSSNEACANDGCASLQNKLSALARTLANEKDLRARLETELREVSIAFGQQGVEPLLGDGGWAQITCPPGYVMIETKCNAEMWPSNEPIPANVTYEGSGSARTAKCATNRGPGAIVGAASCKPK